MKGCQQRERQRKERNKKSEKILFLSRKLIFYWIIKQWWFRCDSGCCVPIVAQVNGFHIPTVLVLHRRGTKRDKTLSHCNSIRCRTTSKSPCFAGNHKNNTIPPSHSEIAIAVGEQRHHHELSIKKAASSSLLNLWNVKKNAGESMVEEIASTTGTEILQLLNPDWEKTHNKRTIVVCRARTIWRWSWKGIKYENKKKVINVY